MFGRGALVGGLLVMVGVAATIFALIEARLAILPLGGFILWIILQACGIQKMLPRSLFGWLYTAIIFGTFMAPSMGNWGTYVRLALASFVLTGLAVAYNARTHSSPRGIGLAFGMTLVGVIGAAMGAVTLQFGLSRLVNWVMFMPVLFLFIRKPDIQGVAFGTLLTAVSQMIGVGLQMLGLLGGTWGGLLLSGYDYSGSASWLIRYTGFVMNPNDLALILTLAVTICTVALFSHTLFRVKVLSLCLIFVFLYGIVLSGSRGGIVAAVLALLVSFAFLRLRGLAAGLAVSSFALMAPNIVTSIDAERILGSLSDLATGEDPSAARRRELWLDRLDAVDPVEVVLGSGFGGYAPSIFAGHRSLDVESELARQATVDNSWLKLLLETGVIGVLGVVLLLGISLAKAVKAARNARNGVGIVAAACLIALIWRSLSVDILDQNPWNAIIWLTAGVAIFSGISDNASETRNRSRGCANTSWPSIRSDSSAGLSGSSAMVVRRRT